MKKKLFQAMLILACGILEHSSAQTITVQAQMTGGGIYSGAGSDCGDCFSGVDPKVYSRFKYSSTGAWGGTQGRENDDVGCDNYGSRNVGGDYTSSGVPSSDQIQIQIDAYEDDNGCIIGGANDGVCGGFGNPSSGDNNVSILGIGVCSYSNRQTQRDNCSSDGSTNDYRVFWRFRWVYDAASLTPANSGATLSFSNILDTAICNGGDPVNLSGTAGITGEVGYQWEVSVNGGGFSAIAGATGLNYNPPALTYVSGTFTTYAYRRLTYYPTSFTGTPGVCNSSGIASGNTLTIRVYPDPDAPSATQSPATINVCSGVTLTLTSPQYAANRGKSCAFEYRFSTNGGATYSAFSPGIPSFASTGTDNRIQMRVSAGCANGCIPSPITTYTWNVAAAPAAPTLNIKSPNLPEICTGTNVNASVNAGTGGVTCKDSLRVSVDGGATWAPYSSGSNISTTSATDSVIVQGMRFNCQTGCVNTSWVGITSWKVNPTPNGSISGTTNLCQDTNVVLTLNFSGGTGPYNITFTDGTNSFTRTGKNNGDTLFVRPGTTKTYSLTSLTDAKSCNRTSGFLGSAVITVNNSLVDVTLLGFDSVKCFGQSTGFININTVGGSPNYTYQWTKNGSNFSVSQNINSLAVGTYKVVATDLIGCKDSLTQEINQPAAALNITSTKTNVTCNGAANGGINANVTGGTTPYSYSWFPSGLTTPSISGLTAGIYTLNVLDKNNCAASKTDTISQPSAFAVDMVASTITHVNCKGNNTGAINVVVTVPNAYIYQWTPASVTGTNPTGLAAGIYALKVKLASDTNCFVTANFTINEPASALTVALASWDSIHCFGQNNGFINITANGGTPAYTYNWTKNGSAYASTEDLTNLSVGTYKVIVNDTKGCKDSLTQILNGPAAALAATINKTQVLCYGASTGSLKASVSGGTSPYTYLWNNGITSDSNTSITAGIYVVTITDNNNCFIVKRDTIIQPAAAPAVSITKKDIPCFGGNNGSLKAIASGGTGSFTFAWSNGGVIDSIINLAPGTYTVTATDANGCSVSKSDNISQPSAALTASIAKTNVACYGNITGSLVATASGGTTNYTYAWSNGKITAANNNLPAGIYSLTITDAKGCLFNSTDTIFEPAAALAVSFTKTNISCNGANNGSLIANPAGGTPAYSFAWSNSAITSNNTNLTPGIYVLTLTDANNCSVTKRDTITQPAPISISNSTLTHVNCKGNTTGAISLSMSPAGTYTFTWSTTSGTPASGSNPTNLAAGTYNLTVSETAQPACSITASFIINEPLSPLKVSIANTDSVKCYNTNTGYINVTGTGGTPTYGYVWNKNGLAYATTEDIYNLGIGVYKVIITDAKGCQDSLTQIINQPAAALSSSISKTNVTCYGLSDGSATVNPTGGTAPYSFLWSNTATSGALVNLTAGSYMVTISDLRGCQKLDTVTIQQPAKFALSAQLTNLSCYNNNSGAINLSVSGAGPYSYLWSNTDTTEDISTLSAGSYKVVVNLTSNAACKDSATYVLTQPDSLFGSISIVNPKCNGYTNGGATISPTGGTPPYNVSWSTVPAQLGNILQNVGAGSVDVMIMDKNNCMFMHTVNIIDPAVFSITTSNVKNVTCNGSNNGELQINTVNGVAPFKYYLNGVLKTSNSVNNLVANQYAIEAIDGNGCSAAINQTITQPSPLSIKSNLTSVNCQGLCNGSINNILSGGTTPYTVSWSNSATTKDIAALCAGKYVITITDSFNCILKDSMTITEPKKLKTIITKQDLKCAGDQDGFALIEAEGGISPYSFVWGTTPAQNGGLCVGLKAGSYLVTTSDNNNCTKIDTVKIIEGAKIDLQLNKTNVKCLNSNTGSVQVIATNGAAPYTYFMNNRIQQTNVFAGLAAGFYSIEVRDKLKCSSFDTFSIYSSNNLKVTLTANKTTAAALEEISLNANAEGGRKPYIKYLWNLPGMDFSACGNKDVCPTPKIKFTESGFVYVIVQDADTCEARDTLFFNIKTEKETFFPTAFTPNADGTNDHFDFEILGSVKNEVSIFDRWGKLMYQNPDQKNGKGMGWDGMYQGKEVPYDAYVFQIVTTYLDGKQKTYSGTVTVLR